MLAYQVRERNKKKKKNVYLCFRFGIASRISSGRARPRCMRIHCSFPLFGLPLLFVPGSIFRSFFFFFFNSSSFVFLNVSAGCLRAYVCCACPIQYPVRWHGAEMPTLPSMHRDVLSLCRINSVVTTQLASL